MIVDEVVPNEIAKSLGVTGLQFRNWLRAQKVLGHPLLAGHEYRTQYRFTRTEAAKLITEYQSDTTTSAPAVQAGPTTRVAPIITATPRDLFAGLTFSENPGHRVTETWMGNQVQTLADLLRHGLRAVVVGINPSPVSVAAGHYYQGQLGQRFYKRLEQAGVMDRSVRGFEDDAAFAAGIGFTDVVKRATSRAHGLRPGELKYGRGLLDTKLADLAVPKVLFTFKASAEALLGPLDGPGVQTVGTIVNAQVFVMPGPMAGSHIVQRTLRDLRAWLEG